MINRLLKSLFVIIGTLIGAGFASGQEIYVFFYKYGIHGIFGIIVSSILLGFVVYKVLIISKNKEIKNYRKFLNLFVNDEHYLDIFNTIINIFILITFYIMIAGFGAYFEQQFNINGLIGSSILAILCFFVLIKNISGLVKVNQVIIPILIISLLIIGVNVIDFKNIFNISNYMFENNSFKWMLDAILYAGYNSILLIPVLIVLKDIVKNKKDISIISVVIIAIVIILSLVIFFMLLKVDVNIENLEMPAIYVATKFSKIFEYIYGFIILSSIFTTSISLGTSFLENVSSSKQIYRRYAILICVSSVIVSKVGFSNLVNLLYPIFGYIGLIQIIKLFRVKK